jgi:hypothetical protein
MVISATKTVARAKDLAIAERLEPFTLCGRQHRVDTRLRLGEQGIEARLHLFTQPAEVLRLLTHDRVDALLLRRAEFELVREPFAHAIPASHVGGARPSVPSSLGRRTKAGRPEPPPATLSAPAVQRQSICSEAEPHACERHHGE